MFYRQILYSVVLFFIVACGGDDDKVTLVDLGLSPTANADDGSSYENRKTDIHISYFDLPIQNVGNAAVLSDAVTYLDADGDNDTDVFVATGIYLLEGEVDSQLFINNGSNVFTLDNSAFNGSAPPATHARKSITADFNNDGLEDMFIFDHGFDAYPFPGNNLKLIIQDSVGNFSWQRMTDQTDFHHGGAAADIDNDGDIDIFVAGGAPFFYINDGQANFTKVDDRYDRSMPSVFTAELIDIDKDGFVDLILGQHEQDGNSTKIYWGSSSGAYSSSLRTVLPAVTNYGTVLDFAAEDFDQDGDRDLFINRTGGGNNNFYQGRRVQLLFNDGNRNFTDVTATQIDNPGTDGNAWIPWFRAQDIDNDGDIDFFSDDKFNNVLYNNNGSGTFNLLTF